MAGAMGAGDLLGGRYRIVRLLGEGGFGSVYKANDERFEAVRSVAIKEMSDTNLSTGEQERAFKDFRREANLLVQLDHPNLPHVSDFFEEHGKAYLVMGFIEGKTLEQVLEDAHGPLGESLVMGWAIQLCGVLQYLHSRPQPIIFRDLKPSNVMVAANNRLKLIDFGIARVFKATATKDTTLLGSQGYAPLEQYGRSQSDPRSDIYALGATLYHLLTGVVPADAPSRRVNPRVFETPRQLNPQISQATEQIILMAMEQDPEERFQSAEAMRKAILEEGVAQLPSDFLDSGILAKAATPQHPTERTSPMPHTITSAQPISPVTTTVERTILPLVLEIGSSIYQAVKERDAKSAPGNAGAIQQPAFYAESVSSQAQIMAPPPAPVRSSSYAYGTGKGLRQPGNAFVVLIRGINSILGWISTLLALLLIARFILTFFNLSAGDFSYWITYLSTPFVAPFGNQLVPFHPSVTATYIVDVSTIIAFVVYSIGFALVRGLLRLFAKKQR